MFYMATRYDGAESSTTDLELSEVPDAANSRMGLLSTLLQWHVADPVSDEERLRNERVCTLYQVSTRPPDLYPCADPRRPPLCMCSCLCACLCDYLELLMVLAWCHRVAAQPQPLRRSSGVGELCVWERVRVPTTIAAETAVAAVAAAVAAVATTIAVATAHQRAGRRRLRRRGRARRLA